MKPLGSAFLEPGGRIRETPLAALAILLVGVAACGKENYGTNTSGGTPCTPTATQACAKNIQFNPLVLNVTAPATVVWLNGDGFAHTVTSSSVPPSATPFNKPLAAGANTSVTFTVAGSYQYYCTIHGMAMHGTINVS